MKGALYLLCFALLAPLAHAGTRDAAPLGERDFAISLPGGTFNMVADARADLERAAGKDFEFYDEFPNLGISYDRLITGAANFFADVDSDRVYQVTFKEGCLTARGIGLNSTKAQVCEVYGEPPLSFEEHGYIRAMYELRDGDEDYELHILISGPNDCVVDIHMNGPGFH